MTVLLVQCSLFFCCFCCYLAFAIFIHNIILSVVCFYAVVSYFMIFLWLYWGYYFLVLGAQKIYKAEFSPPEPNIPKYYRLGKENGEICFMEKKLTNELVGWRKKERKGKSWKIRYGAICWRSILKYLFIQFPFLTHTHTHISHIHTATEQWMVDEFLCLAVCGLEQKRKTEKMFMED